MMGTLVLISGVVLWWAAHLFKRLAPEKRAALGDTGGWPRRGQSCCRFC